MTTRQHLPAFLLLAALVPAGGIAGDPMTPERAREVVDEVGLFVEETRGLEFIQPVPVEVIDDAAAAVYARERIFQFQSAEEIRAQQDALILLGVLPEGTDILASYLEIIEEQAGGFYDPGRKSFYLLDDMPASLAGVLVAHELTHALEDQHYDLDARLKAAEGNDDRLFAVSAVHEGSASLLMMGYMAGAMRDGSLSLDDMNAMAETEAARGEKLGAAPPLVGRWLLGPYVLGMGFLSRGRLAAGMAGSFPVDDVEWVCASGPLSSEQVLHPDKYWDPERRDDPVEVDLEPAEAVLGRRWKPASAGVLGEIGLGVLVGAGGAASLSDPSMMNPDRWTNEAAAGWGGDRWQSWTRGGRTVAVIAIVWDTEADATEFLEALPDDDGVTWRHDGLRLVGVAGRIKPALAEKVFEALLAAQG